MDGLTAEKGVLEVAPSAYEEDDGDEAGEQQHPRQHQRQRAAAEQRDGFKHPGRRRGRGVCEAPFPPVQLKHPLPPPILTGLCQSRGNGRIRPRTPAQVGSRGGTGRFGSGGAGKGLLQGLK